MKKIRITCAVLMLFSIFVLVAGSDAADNSSSGAAGAFKRTITQIKAVENDASLRRLDRANALLSKDPNNEQVLAARAQVYIDLQQYQNALTDLNQVITLNPRSQLYYDVRATAFEKLNSRENELRDLEQALNLGPQSINLLRRKSSALLRLHRYTEALSAVNSSVRFQPNDERSYCIRAEVKYELKDFAGSKQDCDRALLLDPNDADAREFRSTLGKIPQDRI